MGEKLRFGLDDLPKHSLVRQKDDPVRESFNATMLRTVSNPQQFTAKNPQHTGILLSRLAKVYASPQM